MKHLGLFEGIGGFSLAARWMGWETVAWCEWNEFCQKVLKHHFPEAEGHGDITKTDFTKYANKIDILTGGFPCQPWSNAGEQRGVNDERHLFPEMLRAIREIKPKWIVGENVLGITTPKFKEAFNEICTSLENEEYQVQPIIIPATAVKAEHRRERVWIVANSISQGLEGFNTKRENIRLFEGSTPTIISYRDVLAWNEESQPASEHLRGGHGVPTKLHKQSIAALGNAIVPQVAFEIFKTIEQYEQLNQQL